MMGGHSHFSRPSASPFSAAADLLDPPPNPYRTDPTGWAEDRLGEHLWSTQQQIARAVLDKPKVAVPSCHGAGKSHIAADLVAWWLDVHPPGEAFVVSTAPTARQVYGILWRYIRKAHKKAEGRGTPLAGRVLDNAEWKIAGELVGWGRKPADHDENAFQGIHARHVLVVVDEACGVPEQLWTAVEAITTTAGARILAIGNPDNPASTFAKKCVPGSGWHVIPIDGMQTPNISIESLVRAAREELEPPLTDGQVEQLVAEARTAGAPETDDQREPVADRLREELIQAAWIADKVRTFGVGSNAWQSKVRGQFPDEGQDTLIPLGLIQQALDRDYQLQADDPRILSVDVARFGTDETVIGLREGDRLRLLLKDAGKRRTTETAGQAANLHREHRTHEIRVDGVGVGGGVVDELAEDGLPVVDVQAGQAAQDPVRFGNARAEWYWQLRTRFEQGDIDIDDEELAGQLQALKYKFDRKGRIFIESKDDMKKRGMPSPDRADTGMMAFAVLPLWDDDLVEEDFRREISPY